MEKSKVCGENWSLWRNLKLAEKTKACRESPGGRQSIMKNLEEQKRGARMRGITARDSLTAEVREELSERISLSLIHI